MSLETVRDLIVTFIVGSILRLMLDYGWHLLNRKNHLTEEEKTRAEIHRLREQISHMAFAKMEEVELDPVSRAELEAAINGEEVVG